MSIQNPILLDLGVLDASATVCTTAQELCYNYDWFLTILKDGTDGNPTMTVEVSNNAVNWVTYNCKANGVTLTDDYTGFTDDSIPAKYFRLCFEPNGTTTGDLIIDMNLKPS